MTSHELTHSIVVSREEIVAAIEAGDSSLPALELVLQHYVPASIRARARGGSSTYDVGSGELEIIVRYLPRPRTKLNRRASRRHA